MLTTNNPPDTPAHHLHLLTTDEKARRAARGASLGAPLSPDELWSRTVQGVPHDMTRVMPPALRPFRAPDGTLFTPPALPVPVIPDDFDAGDGLVRVWELRCAAGQCSDVVDFRARYPNGYALVTRRGWLDLLGLPPGADPRKRWTPERIREAAAQCESAAAFRREHYGAWQAAYRLNLLASLTYKT